ncbi:MAG: hypothetical protein EBS39_06325, partial [Gammaproteobacteria bacterium]|nr:hypothetical protein [Gammaproteobacteria bacterium]
MSRAAVHDAYGAPRDVLRVVAQDPGDPADGEVVVRMEAAALHIADLRTIEGDATFRQPLPRTPGFEGIGRVERAVGVVDRGAAQRIPRSVMRAMASAWRSR